MDIRKLRIGVEFEMEAQERGGAAVRPEVPYLLNPASLQTP
jgi:hypothetical protein